MIVQERDEGLWLIRQTDHALLSGAFAAAWGSDDLPQPPRRQPTIIGAARHDDGWADWELAPKLRDDGQPVDFIRMPVSDHIELYRRGIDLVQEESAFAGLVASLHGERLYTRSFHPGMDPRIEHLEGRDLELAEQYVRHELERQALLAEAVVDVAGGPLESGDVSADAEEAWRLLQVWDRLSLFVCMNRLGSGADQTLPPVRGADGADVRMTVGTPDDATIVVDPYPFGEDRAEFQIHVMATYRGSWEDEPSFREAFRIARKQTLEFVARPA